MTRPLTDSGESRKRALVACFCALVFALLPIATSAQNNLLFFKAQAVAGYYDHSETWEYYSHHPHHAMQKPSLGIDFISRIGGKTRDIGYFALQARLAYDQSESNNVQPQLYNAFFNWKAPIADVWIGHNKTALGLSSYLDNHALLLIDNSMSGLNFDRDWGAGINYDGDLLDVSFSATTGSGMPLYVGENNLFAARVGLGDLSSHNATVGISGATGKILKSMGYNVMHNNKKHELLLGGIDASWRYLGMEVATDVLYGEYDTDPAYAALGRLGFFLLPEERLKLDLQGHFTELKGYAEQFYSAGLSIRVIPDLTLRSVYTLHYPGENYSIALQAYFYKGIVF
ncbi:MAG: hypothetical protein U1B83_06490 [Candidatus Cloacimonadaceae bacterium]|nr:hypothetical protein [Candidatus Cloacimonadaceae bacterium]